MRSISNLYTLGYEGLSLEAFIDRLKEAGVKTVIDVRELPLSRKKGFSKRSFAEAWHGVEANHLPVFVHAGNARGLGIFGAGGWIGFAKNQNASYVRFHSHPFDLGSTGMRSRNI